MDRGEHRYPLKIDTSVFDVTVNNRHTSVCSTSDFVNDEIFRGGMVAKQCENNVTYDVAVRLVSGKVRPSNARIKLQVSFCFHRKVRSISPSLRARAVNFLFYAFPYAFDLDGEGGGDEKYEKRESGNDENSGDRKIA